MYEALIVEKLTYEVMDVFRDELKKHAETKSKQQTLTAQPGPFIQGVIYSLSNVLLKELNIAFENYHKEEHQKTAYTHEPMTLCEFAGFNAQQLRLRLPGPGLDVHVDRASAKLTILFYLNDCEDGEIVLYLLPEDERQEEKKKSL